MTESDPRTPGEERNDSSVDRPVSRRGFLKIAAGAGVTLGAIAGSGVFLGACAARQDTTTTIAATSTTVGETTTSVAGSTTTVSAGPETGDEIKAGYVIPVTGGMAAFGEVASWHIDYFNKNVWRDGFVMGDGKLHKLTVIAEDMRSDWNRAAQVAGDLVQNQKVVMIGASAGAENVIPVRDTCETMECPCITYDCPGDVWNAAQPEGGFKWCWHTWFMLKDLAANFIAMWDMIPTNRKVGGLYPEDGDGDAFANGLPAAFQLLGYAYVDPGRYQNGAEDYAAIISRFRKEGCEIINGVPTPPDFAEFWRQAVQQRFHPKVSTMAKAMLLPAGVDALGDLGDGMTVECWFHPAFPYKSDMLGLTPQEVCDMWEADTGTQWAQPLCFFGQFEVFTDIFKRCPDPTNTGTIIETIKQTRLMTVGGLVEWTVNPEPYSGWNNFCTKPIAGGQWVKGAGRWQYDLNIVASVTQTDIKTTGRMKELQYPS